MPLVVERAKKAQVDLVNETPLRVCELHADQKRLVQIVYNLVINAIEHTPPSGRIAFGAELSADEVRVYVSDSGVGIPAAYQPVAFERFQSTTRTKDARRAGLGLALVRSFVELHGGWVEMDSVVGRGTRVTCHFPRRHALARTPGATIEGAEARAQ
jgi:signal transduction histidine kinase